MGITKLVPALILLAAASPADADSLLVANKTDGTVNLIDLATGEERLELPTGKAPHEAAVSPDRRTAVISNYGTRENPGSSLTVLDLARGAVARTVPLGKHQRPHGLAWVSDRKVAVTTEGSKHLLVVDPHTGTVVAEIPTGQDVSHMVVVTPDGSRAFVANIGSGSVTVIDLVVGKKLRDLPTGAGAEGLAVSPGGKELWVANRDADKLTVVDAATLEVLAVIDCPGFPIRVAFTPDGQRVLVSCARAGEIALYDARARKPLLRRKLDLKNAPDAATRLFGDRFGESPVPVGLVVDAGGAKAYVAATQADAIVIVDTRTLEVQGLLEAGREPDGMALVAARLSTREP